MRTRAVVWMAAAASVAGLMLAAPSGARGGSPSVEGHDVPSGRVTVAVVPALPDGRTLRASVDFRLPRELAPHDYGAGAHRARLAPHRSRGP
jgi:hypothetical protein